MIGLENSAFSIAMFLLAENIKMKKSYYNVETDSKISRKKSKPQRKNFEILRSSFFEFMDQNTFPCLLETNNSVCKQFVFAWKTMSV